MRMDFPWRALPAVQRLAQCDSQHDRPVAPLLRGLSRDREVFGPATLLLPLRRVALVLILNLALNLTLTRSYEIGVTGGVTSMAAFERRFFPTVYARQIETAGLFAKSPYCRFSDQRFQLFTSSIFLAGACERPSAHPLRFAAHHPQPAQPTASESPSRGGCDDAGAPCCTPLCAPGVGNSLHSSCQQPMWSPDPAHVRLSGVSWSAFMPLV